MRTHGFQLKELKKTVFYDQHVSLGARMVEFAGWEMPVYYPSGILDEHVAARKQAGLFDVTHMGRFLIRGTDAKAFLQRVLSNNVQELEAREKGAQYTFIPNDSGGAVDDAYLYRLREDEYLLVVNASNKEKDWEHLLLFTREFRHLEIKDRSEAVGMLALQGPLSRQILKDIVKGPLPPSVRNALRTVRVKEEEVIATVTGYTGSDLGFELFFESKAGPAIWDLMVSKGAVPVGLAARDTLRLEAGLPLYGHELGKDPEGREIPILACPLARFGVSFSPVKGDFVGRAALQRQREALEKIRSRDYSRIGDLPRRIFNVAVIGRGIARRGDKVYKGHKQVGPITSGTAVPIWDVESEPPQRRTRAIALAYLDSDLIEGDEITVEIRGRHVEAVVVARHMN